MTGDTISENSNNNNNSSSNSNSNSICSSNGSSSSNGSEVIQDQLQQIVPRVSNTVAAFWLIVWTLNNIGVTLINKAAFTYVDFPYPYTLSAIHMLFCSVGSTFIFWCIGRSSICHSTCAGSSRSIQYEAVNSSTTNEMDENDNDCDCDYTDDNSSSSCSHEMNINYDTVEEGKHEQQQPQQQQSHRKRKPPPPPLRQRGYNHQQQPTEIYQYHQQQQQQQEHNKGHFQSITILLDSIAIFVSDTLLGGSGNEIQRQQLDQSGNRLLVAFSIIFTLNIATGNVSLQYVSVNFNQVVRSLVPALTMWIGIIYFHHTFSIQRQRSVLPIVFGVAMAGYGDRMSFTSIGLFYTILCTVLASLKVVASGEMLTGANIKLHPLDLLHRMAPLALMQCSIFAIGAGEISTIMEQFTTELSPIITLAPILVVSLSGILAFALNISALQAYRVTSPLTCCIVAAVKQVVTIGAGTIMFQTPVTPMNGIGITIVLLASARYSYIAVIESNSNSSKSCCTNSTTSTTEALPTTSVPIQPLRAQNTNVSSAGATVEEDICLNLLSNNTSRSISPLTVAL